MHSPLAAKVGVFFFIKETLAKPRHEEISMGLPGSVDGVDGLMDDDEASCFLFFFDTPIFQNPTLYFSHFGVYQV